MENRQEGVGKGSRPLQLRLIPVLKGDNCEKGNACGLAQARFHVLAPPAKVVDTPLQGAQSTSKVSSGAKQCTSDTGSTSPTLGSGWTQPVWSLCQPEREDPRSRSGPLPGANNGVRL
ncbi:hypothetical protein LguiB_029271 [Lonicera macranthoides]